MGFWCGMPDTWWGWLVGWLVGQVIFVPDYNVSVAEMLIPASELSQHIRSVSNPTHSPAAKHGNRSQTDLSYRLQHAPPRFLLLSFRITEIAMNTHAALHYVVCTSFLG